jgi:hypothetical protein
MKMRLHPIVLAAAIGAAGLLSACADNGFGGPGYYAGGDYDAWYDGAYGPYYGGYWGGDNLYHYDDGRHHFHADAGGHFRHADGGGFQHIQGHASLGGHGGGGHGGGGHGGGGHGGHG